MGRETSARHRSGGKGSAASDYVIESLPAPDETHGGALHRSSGSLAAGVPERLGKRRIHDHVSDCPGLARLRAGWRTVPTPAYADILCARGRTNGWVRDLRVMKLLVPFLWHQSVRM